MKRVYGWNRGRGGGGIYEVKERKVVCNMSSERKKGQGESSHVHYTMERGCALEESTEAHLSARGGSSG